MKIDIQSIPHNQQRYETVGDWRLEGDALKIRVSELPDWRYDVLVGIHELIEAVLCDQACVSQTAVDEFDMDYEKNRQPGDESEPGDDPRSPYRKQHFVATTIERQLAHELGVDWDEYERAIQAL